MSQYYELVAPGTIPVTLDEVKCHLKVTTDLDDDFLTDLLEAATQAAEKYTTRELRANTWDLTIDCFETRIEIRKDPVDSITSINRLVSGTPTAVATSVYYLKKNAQFDEILLQEDQEWPNDVDEREAAITIRFVTKAHRCLSLAKHGISRHAAFLYENRGDCDPFNATDSIHVSGAGVLYDQMRVPRI